MRSRRLCTGLALLLLLAAVLPVRAQGADVFDVYLGTGKNGISLYFVDARTGLSSVVPADGTRHTLLADGVLFQEKDTGIFKIAYPDGQVGILAAMQPAAPNVVVDWAVSANRQHIVWSVTQRQDSLVYSDLYLGDSKGSKTLALHTSSTQSVGAMPLALTDDAATIFYTRRADLFAPRPLFLSADNVFRLDVASGQSAPLTVSNTCPCAVAFSQDGRLFGALEPTGQGGFNLHLWDLSINVDWLVNTTQTGQEQAGALAISPESRVAVYTTAHDVGKGRYQYTLVLADLGQREQHVLTSTRSDNLRVAAFLVKDSAVLLVGNGGSYKLSFNGGTLLQVSSYVFLGSIPSKGSVTP
jgi:hypothetical protein